MTGGHENQPGAINAGYVDSQTKVTTGGQIGAPNESGCCTTPPQKGKCVDGACTSGLNAINPPPDFFCLSDSDCPASTGTDSACPWGDWEHNHHYGPDDSYVANAATGISGGSFAFHSGTAASPNNAFIQNVNCEDEGWCVQARPAPNKQIYWEGTGVFHNMKDKNNVSPLPVFQSCATQPVAWSQGKKNKYDPPATIHYYTAHVGDFGEPAGQRQKPVDGCGLQGAPLGDWSMTCDSTVGVQLIPQHTDETKTLLHPLCLAQDCSVDTEVTDGTGCPDWYDIEIHCGATPDTPVAYTFKHFILEGNFQLHPAVQDSCNFRCNGTCEVGVLGNAETCNATCSLGDCCL
jgi:hypothetical protein